MDSDGDGIGDACDACPEVFGEDCEIFDQGFSTFAQIGIPTFYNRTYGDKRYEFTNHLGNVVSVITDRGTVREPSNGFVLNPNFLPNVVNMHDYYPFGMLMPIRNLSADEYSYGFNGEENDNEIKGDGNSIDYGFRMYDPRIGRFLSVDPLTAKFPSWSPYAFAFNNPILNLDMDGLEGITNTHRLYFTTAGFNLFKKVTSDEGGFSPLGAVFALGQSAWESGYGDDNATKGLPDKIKKNNYWGMKFNDKVVKFSSFDKGFSN